MATFNVTSTTDDGTGLTSGTLSYAILQANQLAGDDTISIDTDVRITGVMKTLVNSNITIVGNNHSISGDANNNGINDNGDLRPLFILGGNVAISDLTITNGRAKGGDSSGGGGGAGMGGGLFIVDGNVSLTRVSFTDNVAQGGSSFVGGFQSGGGGGMFGNSAQGGGGLFGSAVDGNGGYGGNGNYGGSGGQITDGSFSFLSDGGFGGGGGLTKIFTGGAGGFGGGGSSGAAFVRINAFASGGDGGVGGFGGGGGFTATRQVFGYASGTGGFGGYGGGAGGSYAVNPLGSQFVPGFAGGVGGYRHGGGGAGLGGAIFIRSGSLALTDTTFTGNAAIPGSGFTPGQSFGGAIFAMRSTVNSNGKNQGMPTVLPSVTTDFTPTFSNNSAIGNISTNNIYGTVIITSVTPTVSITALTPTATEEGTAGVFRISRTATPVDIGDLTVNLTIDGTGAAAVEDYGFTTPDDYTLSGGNITVAGNAVTVTIPRGQSFVDVEVAATDNFLPEPDETLTLKLVDGLDRNTGTGYLIDPVRPMQPTSPSATVTIATNDLTNLTVYKATDDGGGNKIGTLSWAIKQANQLPGDDTITINTDVRVTGVMKSLVNSNITIVGNNHTISGDANNNGINDNGDLRPLFILSGNVAISDLTITNGRAKGGDSDLGGSGAGMGGGLFIYDGNVSLNNVAFTNNAAQGGSGISSTVAGGAGMFGGSRVNGSGGLFGDGYNGGYGGTGNYGGFGGFGAGGNGGFGGGGASGGVLLYQGYISKGGNGGFGGGGGIGSDGGDGGFGGGGGTGTQGIGGNGGYGGGAGIGVLEQGNGGFGGGGNGGYGFNDYGNTRNDGAGFGGGIFIRSGTLTLKNTTFTGNTATGGKSLVYGVQVNPGLGKGGAIFIMQSTTNTNGNNQGMPTVLPTVNYVENSPSFSNNSAADDAGTATDNDDIYGTINIASVNNPPTAIDDAVSTDENTSLSGNVLAANPTTPDSDPDNNTLTLTEVNGQASNVGTSISLGNGLLIVNGNGSFNFNPNNGYESLAQGNSKTETFTYTISDGNGGTDSANVTITINGVNDAATISGTATASVTEDSTNPNLTANGSLGVSDVDTGENKFNTSVTSAQGNLGSLSITDTGSWDYTVANSTVQYLGAGKTKTDTFTVRSLDGTATQDITVTINGVNDAATISGTATASVTEDSTNPNLTANGSLGVSDVDTGENKFNTSVTSAQGNLGSLSITDTGSWDYTVANSTVQYLGAGKTKTDTFTVRSLDGIATKDITVTINGVNDNPVAVADSFLATQGTSLNITVASLLANDSDVDTGDVLKITGVSNAVSGTAVFNTNGTPSNPADDFITFNPTSSGSGSFRYTLSDGKGGTTTGTANLLIGSRQIGGTGNNTLTGNAGPDFLQGRSGSDSLFGNDGNDTLVGGIGSDLIVGGAGSDSLTGGLGVDTFRFTLTDSLLPNIDRITDLQIGTDIFDGPNAVSATNLRKLGSAASLSTTDVAALLTTSNFVANGAATFTVGSSRYVALNNSTAGFQAATDAVINITGFSGNINNLAIT